MKNNNPPIGGNKLIVIVGPTASGKSDLAVKISRRVNGEIISADSRQVYRDMDIGTGKITEKEMFGVAHHLLDAVSPKANFNVSHFKRLAQKKIAEITNRGKVPIIVGGTGFWIDALIYNWPIPEVGPNRALRARLEKWSTNRLFAKLQKLDPLRAATIKNRDEINNKRRLVRAIEIVMATGKPVPKFVIFKSDCFYMRQKIGEWEYKILILGIKRPKKEHEMRINYWLTKRLKDKALIKEVKKLHRLGVSWKRLDTFGLVYREVSQYLRNQLTYGQMRAEILKNLKNYAKRQMRWFKRNKQIKWINGSNQAIRLVQKFIG